MLQYVLFKTKASTITGRLLTQEPLFSVVIGWKIQWKVLFFQKEVPQKLKIIAGEMHCLVVATSAHFTIQVV